MATLTLPIVLGLLGMAVDVGWMYWRKQACMAAAQAASAAAAVTASKLASSWPATCCASTTTTGIWCSSTATVCPTTVTNPPTNNFQTACLDAQANGFTVTAGGRKNVMVTANNGSTLAVPGVSPSYFITVRVTERVPLTFLAVLGAGIWGNTAATSGISGRPTDRVSIFSTPPARMRGMRATTRRSGRPAASM